LVGHDRLKYKSIIMNDKEFHIFAFFKYGLLINYNSNTDELLIDEVESIKSDKLTKEDLISIKFSVDRFGSLDEFQSV
jgi:hypothetical protein